MSRQRKRVEEKEAKMLLLACLFSMNSFYCFIITFLIVIFLKYKHKDKVFSECSLHLLKHVMGSSRMSSIDCRGSIYGLKALKKNLKKKEISKNPKNTQLDSSRRFNHGCWAEPRTDLRSLDGLLQFLL